LVDYVTYGWLVTYYLTEDEIITYVAYVLGDYYTKTEIGTLLSDYYTKHDTDVAIDSVMQNHLDQYHGGG